MRLVDAGVTVKERILLHLLDHWGQMYRGEFPESITQDGIASVVGISRSHVAVSLPDLVDAGMVETRVDRVQGRTRRVKVYFLTFQGGRAAGELAQRLLATKVTAHDDTGEWDIPLDGLIQLHKVHMLTAVRLVGEDNRLDLIAAAELVRPPGEAGAEVGKKVEAEVGKKVEAEVGGRVGAEAWEEAEEVPAGAVGAEEATGVSAEAEAKAKAQGMPAGAAPQVPRAEARAGAAAVPAGEPWRAAGPRQPPPWVQHGPQPPQMYFWNPLRFGSGRRPDTAYVATTLTGGFLSLMVAATFAGLNLLTCSAIWVPMLVIGIVLGYFGFTSTWAMGERREAWVAGALASYLFAVVTLVSFGFYGPEVVFDLLVAGLILGVPSLVLAAGTGRSVGRRGSFMLFIGPVMVIAAMTLGVLDPGSIGRSGATPLLVVSVGASWTFVGWVMGRRIEGRGALPSVIAGGAVGLALAALSGAAHLASQGELTATGAMAVALWVTGAVYVATISLHPTLARYRPDPRASYAALAVAGSAALLTASAIFLTGGLFTVGLIEVVVAVGLIVMVAPELGRSRAPGYILGAVGAMIGVASVLAVSVAL